MEFEPVIGLETHIEMQTASKMFCGCPVIDSVTAPPNTAVCEVCAGLPGTLPVINRQAVTFALRVALALGCDIQPVSVFARKNYFYPDLPKGYQISQYEQPLAINGQLRIETPQGERVIRIRRVHLEEDTGKLTHVETPEGPHSLVDLNRAGVPLLEVVTEPDFRSAAEVRAYAEALRALVRALGVNSGDLEKGVIRIEPNISVRLVGQAALGTKVEIKNLNSFRALERGVDYEIRRQLALLQSGQAVTQETVGWDEASQSTYSQRSKEDAHDYRYFPEPDLPPLVVSAAWVSAVRRSLPELPWQRARRYREQMSLPAADAARLAAERALGEYFDRVVDSGAGAKAAANWVLGPLMALMNERGLGVESLRVSPNQLADLIALVEDGVINQNTAKNVLTEMFETGRDARQIVQSAGLGQVSDDALIARLVAETLAENPAEVASYRAGKAGVANWLFGQVMKKMSGRGNPHMVRQELMRQLGG